MLEATICYTVSPVHSIDRFVRLGKEVGRSGNGYDLYQGHGRTLGPARRLPFGASAESRRQGPPPSPLTLHLRDGLDDLVDGDPRGPGHAGHFHFSVGRGHFPSSDGNAGRVSSRIPPTIRDWSSHPSNRSPNTSERFAENIASSRATLPAWMQRSSCRRFPAACCRISPPS